MATKKMQAHTMAVATLVIVTFVLVVSNVLVVGFTDAVRVLVIVTHLSKATT